MSMSDDLKRLVVEEARRHLGERYNSMDSGRQGWGCAMFCAHCLNSVLGTDYYGSAYEFAGSVLEGAHRQGHGYPGEFERVMVPEPGDVVVYLAPGYDGADAEDYGHVALYVGGGHVIGAWGHGTIGEPGYWAGQGVCETTTEYQTLGHGWMYVRCKRMYDDWYSKPQNDLGMRYRAHVQGLGWMASVRDGMRAGTEGACRRLEALKMTPPEGVELDVVAHVQDVGDKVYRRIRKGKSSGTGSSDNDPIIGTVGEHRRLEGISIDVTRNDGPCKGKSIRYMGHVQGFGWTRVCRVGEYCGTRGQSKRLEAVRIWFE